MKRALFIVIIFGVALFFLKHTKPTPSIVATPIITTKVNTPTTEKHDASDSSTEGLFSRTVLTTNTPGAELIKQVGAAHVFTVLAINRVDDRNLQKGMSIVVPKSFEDPSLWEFMPEKISAAVVIPKLVIISQRTQSFGLYEKGVLVRSGPVSTGKEDTPTTDGLYFTNWKGKEVTSTFSDEWLLKWNFNIDNANGIGMHQYALPGRPASHSCIRLYQADAQWLYDWADQWILAVDGKTELAQGTPVIVYGQYDFKKSAPWKRLVTDPFATKVTGEELEKIVSTYSQKIQEARAKRLEILNG